MGKLRHSEEGTHLYEDVGGEHSRWGKDDINYETELNYMKLGVSSRICFFGKNFLFNFWSN